MVLLKPTHRFFRGLRPWAGLGILLAVWAGGAGPARAAATLGEYQLKAVFLFNFTRFVEWPASAFAEPQSPFVIGVLGADPFGIHLDEVVQGEQVNGRPLVVRRYRRVEEIEACHVLYIAPAESGQLADIFGRLKGRSILAVGETEDFATQGGTIRFVSEKNKVRLRINLESAKAAGLVISSKLLKPAEIVAPASP